MRAWRLLLVVPVAAIVAIGIANASEQDAVPVYTNEDLDRMLGPSPAQPTDPVDKTSPQDWQWVEQFLDRQYSRIDADRRYDLDRRSVDVAAEQVERIRPGYGWPVAWRLGYPASTWWNTVWSAYSSNSRDDERHQHDGWRGFEGHRPARHR
jgi:hypothetical protein